MVHCFCIVKCDVTCLSNSDVLLVLFVDWRLLRSAEDFGMGTWMVCVWVSYLCPLSQWFDVVPTFDWFFILESSILKSITGSYSFIFLLRLIKNGMSTLVSSILTFEHRAVVGVLWVRTANARIYYNPALVGVWLVWWQKLLWIEFMAFLTEHVPKLTGAMGLCI